LCGARRVKNAIENAAAAQIALAPEDVAHMRGALEALRAQA
jgi:aryl-alcohol dehydrogenase-like predicted oxidoreductase